MGRFAGNRLVGFGGLAVVIATVVVRLGRLSQLAAVPAHDDGWFVATTKVLGAMGLGDLLTALLMALGVAGVVIGFRGWIASVRRWWAGPESQQSEVNTASASGRGVAAAGAGSTAIGEAHFHAPPVVDPRTLSAVRVRVGAVIPGLIGREYYWSGPQADDFGLLHFAVDARRPATPPGSCQIVQWGLVITRTAERRAILKIRYAVTTETQHRVFDGIWLLPNGAVAEELPINPALDMAVNVTANFYVPPPFDTTIS